MAYPDSVTRVTPNAGGSLTDSGVTAGMRKLAIDNQLRLQMTLDDVFSDFQSEVIKDPDGMDIPNSIFLRFGTTPMKGSHRITVPLTTPYTGSLLVGDVYVPGNEVKDVLRYFTMYYGEYAYAVSKDNFGRTANEMDMYNVYEKQTPKIAHFLSEQKGYRIREALLETADYVVAGDNSEVTQKWNNNWYVANADPAVSDTDDWGQPDFTTAAAFEDRLGSVMRAAAGVDATAAQAANISFENIRSIALYARLNKHIEQLDDGTYIMVVPSSQIKLLKALDADAGTTYLDQYRKEGTVVNYAYKVGRIENVEIYCDDRYPRVVHTVTDVAGTETSTLAATYVGAGNVDNRDFAPHGGISADVTADSSESGNWDIGYLLGKAAVAEWEVTPVHYETQKSNYNKREGNGAFGENGYTLVTYDNDAGFATDSTARINIGSIVCAWTAPSLV